MQNDQSPSFADSANDISSFSSTTHINFDILARIRNIWPQIPADDAQSLAKKIAQRWDHTLIPAHIDAAAMRYCADHCIDTDGRAYWAITGRIDGNSDDITICNEIPITEDEAREEFIDTLIICYLEKGSTGTVSISSVVKSVTPITQV